MDSGALRDWWRSLAAPPEPLARPERWAFGLACIAVGVTRLAAVSRTLWDWDEALLVLGVRDFDVVAHHPHPPGFPLFVAAAKLLPFEPFVSLRTIVVLAALFVFPAAFALARELRLQIPTAFASALLLSFMPNVWFFGGTAFSDIPSMVLALAAGAQLLRGCRSGRALLAGAVLLGAGAAIRPQNLLLGAAPMLVAFSHRRVKTLVAGLVTAAIVAISFAAAAQASGGWEPYRDALRAHESYIRARDSFVSPVRPPLHQLADDFFLRPWRAPLLNIVVTGLAALGLLQLRRRAGLSVALATFGPFALAAWLLLDFHSASRFSLGYVPLVAILAAEGLPVRWRVSGATALAAAMFVWSWPALRVVRQSDSPPADAAAVIRGLDPRATKLYVDPRLAAHAEVLLPEYSRAEAHRLPIVMHERASAVLLQEGSSSAAGARNFERPRERLAGIARPRYFEASVVPAPRIAFGEGWHAEEGDRLAPFRWMGRRSVARFAARPGAVLSIRLTAPAPATVTLRTDRSLLERIAPGGGTIQRTWPIAGARELVIETSAPVRVPGDPRELGLRLEALEIR